MKLIDSKCVGYPGKFLRTWLANNEDDITSDFDPESVEGSMIMVISTGAMYIKNCDGKWQKYGTSEVI